jgi:hypothetical protein
LAIGQLHGPAAETARIVGCRVLKRMNVLLEAHNSQKKPSSDKVRNKFSNRKDRVVEEDGLNQKKPVFSLFLAQ